MATQAQTQPATRTRAGLRWRWPEALITALIAAGALVVIFPFIWMLLSSFKTIRENNVFPPTLIPQEWHPQNYATAWFKPPSTLGRYLLNSTIIAALGTLLQTAFCALAAYAFSRLRFPGRDLLFMLVLATTMLPNEVSLIPNFVTIRRFPLLGGNDLWGNGGSGLYDTYLGIILPGLVGAFNIFLLRQSFLTVPNDLWEAAQVDGCGSFQYLWQVMLPLTMPTLLTVAIFGFIGRWNSVLWPLIITRSEGLRPVQLAMIYFQSEFLTDYGSLMAASLIVTLPIVLLYILVQRQFIAGIMNTGLKG